MLRVALILAMAYFLESMRPCVGQDAPFDQHRVCVQICDGMFQALCVYFDFVYVWTVTKRLDPQPEDDLRKPLNPKNNVTRVVSVFLVSLSPLPPLCPVRFCLCSSVSLPVSWFADLSVFWSLRLPCEGRDLRCENAGVDGSVPGVSP